MLIAFLNYLAGLMGAYPNSVYYGLVVLGVVLLAAALAGYWKIFEKMNEPGWKALIPIYSNWIIFDRCAEIPHLFFVYAIAAILEFIANFGVFGMFSAGVEEWARIVCSGTELYMLTELARCFGKGWSTGVGLWLAEFAFAPMLGFGDARFLGCHTARHRFGVKQAFAETAENDVALPEFMDATDNAEGAEGAEGAESAKGVEVADIDDVTEGAGNDIEFLEAMDALADTEAGDAADTEAGDAADTKARDAAEDDA